MATYLGRIAPATLLALVVGGTSWGQAPQTQVVPPRSFLDGTELVLGNVEVRVTGRDGAPVEDLTVNDFQLWLDGAPWEISNFGRVESSELVGRAAQGGAPGPGAIPLPPDPQPRVIVLYIDNANSTLFNRNLVVSRLIGYVTENLRPPDRAVVVVFDRYLRFETPLTADVHGVVAALERVKETSRNIGTNQRLLLNLTRQIAASGSSLTGRRNQELGLLSVEPNMGAMARATAQQLRDEIRRSLEAFKTLLRTMSGVPGNKSLIYVSDGVPLEPGREAREGLSGGSGESETRLGILELARWAAAAEVTLYTVDARGLIGGAMNAAEYGSRVPPGVETAYVQNYQDSLILMAKLSGGYALINTNRFEQGLARVDRAMQSYYSLGFPLPSTGKDASHSIRVAVRDRGNLHLAYRRSLVERSAATKVGDQTVAALAVGLSENRLGVRVQVGESEKTEKRRLFRVPITFLVPGRELALLPDGTGTYRGSLNAYVIAEGPEGERSALAEEAFTIAVPADEFDSLGMLGLQTMMELEKGTWRLSVGVLDGNGGGTGYTMTRLCVP